MDAIRKAVLACMENCTPADDLVLSLNTVISQEGEYACKIILEVLTHLDFDTRTAVGHWREIVSHQQHLSAALGRPVNLPVTVCDYFHGLNQGIGFPKLIDLNEFEKIVHRNQRDFMTGLLNREAFEQAFRQEFARAVRHKRKLSLLFIDIDSFKKVNDEYGHMVGDTLLRSLGKVIAAGKRQEDLAARFGGDEFVMLLPDTKKNDALVLAERLRATVAAEKMDCEGKSLQVSLSCGGATFPDDAADVGSLMQCADHALYRAKRGGKNSVRFHKLDSRNAARIPYVKQIKWKSLREVSEAAILAESMDICADGILLVNNRAVQIGSVIEVDLDIAGENKAVQGRVVRSQQLALDKYAVGVSFLERQEAVNRVADNYVLNSPTQWGSFCQ